MSNATVTANYTVTGMTCGHCVQAVRSELEAVPGVESVEVDLDSGVATVRSLAALDPEVVRAAIDEAGYEVKL